MNIWKLRCLDSFPFPRQNLVWEAWYQQTGKFCIGVIIYPGFIARGCRGTTFYLEYKEILCCCDLLILLIFTKVFSQRSVMAMHILCYILQVDISSCWLTQLKLLRKRQNDGIFLNRKYLESGSLLCFWCLCRQLLRSDLVVFQNSSVRILWLRCHSCLYCLWIN